MYVAETCIYGHITLSTSNAIFEIPIFTYTVGGAKILHGIPIAQYIKP